MTTKAFSKFYESEYYKDYLKDKYQIDQIDNKLALLLYTAEWSDISSPYHKVLKHPYLDRKSHEIFKEYILKPLLSNLLGFWSLTFGFLTFKRWNPLLKRNTKIKQMCKTILQTSGLACLFYYFHLRNL